MLSVFLKGIFRTISDLFRNKCQLLCNWYLLHEFYIWIYIKTTCRIFHSCKSLYTHFIWKNKGAEVKVNIHKFSIDSIPVSVFEKLVLDSCISFWLSWQESIHLHYQVTRPERCGWWKFSISFTEGFPIVAEHNIINLSTECQQAGLKKIKALYQLVWEKSTDLVTVKFYSPGVVADFSICEMEIMPTLHGSCKYCTGET